MNTRASRVITNMYNVEEIDYQYLKLRDKALSSRRKSIRGIIRKIRRFGSERLTAEELYDIEDMESCDAIKSLYNTITRTTMFFLQNYRDKNGVVFEECSDRTFNSLVMFWNTSKASYDTSMEHKAKIILAFCEGQYSCWFKEYKKQHHKYIKIMRTIGRKHG